VLRQYGRVASGFQPGACQTWVAVDSREHSRAVRMKKEIPVAGQEVPLVIVGAGFGGLAMAIRLQKAGRRDFLILEKASGFGGTWHDNTYPGCACDIPSHLYSLSFEQQPRWSRHYATQPEILSYLDTVASRHTLHEKTRFNTEVRSLSWDARRKRWRIETGQGEPLIAQVVVLAVGGLHIPSVPAIDGLDRFPGPWFHSARWRHDVDLTGKRVAVIGSGASAVQIVPAIAEQVGRLALFQRTPAWVLPRKDTPIPALLQQAFAAVPGLQRLWRWVIYLRQESIAIAYTQNPKLLGHWQKQTMQLIQEAIADHDLRDKLWPRYPLGCKRALLSDDYYPALARENVELVTEPIREIDERTIVTADGTSHEVDVIVLATGFRTFNPATEIEITGRGGCSLAEDWVDGPEAYNGVLVAGYPNLFMLMGPNSGLGHNSIVFMIEAQVRYILSCLGLLASGRLPQLEVRDDIQRLFNQQIQERFQDTVWVSDGSPWRKPCMSWYKTASGRLTALWPGFSASYWWRLRRANFRDFLTAEQIAAEAAPRL
jgi:cation diffusion facilitator CzcD-associated flavoprotein CzcO